MTRPFGRPQLSNLTPHLGVVRDISSKGNKVRIPTPLRPFKAPLIHPRPQNHRLPALRQLVERK